MADMKENALFYRKVLLACLGTILLWLAFPHYALGGNDTAENKKAVTPERQRDALVCQHWHGWPVARIAQHLDCSAEALAGLLKRDLLQRWE
jgi:hypothetical protein